MTERLHEGQLVGIVLREEVARIRLQKIELAKVNYIDDRIIFRFPSENYKTDLERELDPKGEKGIQLVIPQLSGILDANK